MSGELNILEGVTIPGWFHRYLEVTTPAKGQGNVPPPVAPVVPPPPPRVDNFSKISKDLCAMGGKPFRGTETLVEARNWLKETEDLFRIFEVDDRRKIQLAVWQPKDDPSFWWEVMKAGRPV